MQIPGPDPRHTESEPTGKTLRNLLLRSSLGHSYAHKNLKLLLSSHLDFI